MSVTNNMYRCDVRSQTWILLARMPVAKYNHTASICGAGIIVVCGSSKEQRHMNTVELYDITKNKWQNKNYFPKLLTSAASCTVKNKVYVSGGQLPDGNPSDCVYEYDAKGDVWLLKGHLNKGVFSHGMCPIDDIIYNIGGECKEFVNIDLQCIDLQTWQCTNLKTMPHSRAYTSAVCVGDYIYVAGGYGTMRNHEGQNSYNTDTILVYDSLVEKWHEVTDIALPQALSDCRVVALVLPHNKEDDSKVRGRETIQC